MKETGNGKLTFKEKCIYGLAGIGDGTTYCFLATFLMFFLTTVAGIAPAAAGFIVAMGTVCDVLAGPFVGYFSDNCKSRFGKRRPFIFCGAIPLAITTTLLFTFIDLSPGLKIAYYGVMVVLFWGSFSLFFVPYTALGSELTTDYDERIVLRSFTSVCNNIGNIIGSVLPSFLVGIIMDGGQSQSFAWTITALGVGLFSGAAVMATALGTGKRDKASVEQDIIPAQKKSGQRFSFRKMFGGYVEILKLRPMQILVAASIIALSGLTLSSADRMYFNTYNCGFSSGEISMILLLGSLAGFLAPVLIGAVTRFMDKRMAFIVIMGVFAVIMAAFRLWNIDSLWQAILIGMVFGVGYMSYWQLMPLLLYDICEYDNYINGKQRSGQIMSLQGTAEGVAEAIGSQLLGVILQIRGFRSGADTQTAVAEAAINNCMFILPAILLLISCVLIWKYPITRQKFEEIRKSVQDD